MPMSKAEQNLYGSNLIAPDDELSARSFAGGYVPGTNFTNMPDDVYYNRPKAQGLFSGDTAVSRAADNMLNTFSAGFAGDRSGYAGPTTSLDALAGLLGFIPTIPLSVLDNTMKTFQQIEMDKNFSKQYFSNQEISDQMNNQSKFSEGYNK